MKKIPFVYIIVVVLSLLGCERENKPKESLESPNLSPLITIKETFQITRSPTPEATQTVRYRDLLVQTATNVTTQPTNEPIIDILPPFVVNISASKDGDSKCVETETNKIYYIGSDNRINLLLSDPGINFNHPSWSPDGGYIAYVESSLDFSATIEMNGFDSVWMMDIQTGERQRISDYIPNSYELHEFGCRVIDHIIPPLRWSPNGKYLIFKYYDAALGGLRYYLIDVAANEMNSLPITQSLVTPTWVPNTNSFLTVEENSIKIFDLVSLSEIKQRKIDFPTEMRLYELPEWIRFGDASRFDNQLEFYDNSTIIGSFMLVNKRSRVLSTWTLNLGTGEWKEIISQGDRSDPIVGKNHLIMIGDSGRIIFLTKNNWKVIKSINGMSAGNTIWNRIKLFESNSGEDLVSYVDFEQDKILIENFIDNNALVAFDISYILFPAEYKYIVDYSWRP